jgi:hypothetical protein
MKAPFPHCDPYILHAPGECKFCDKYPDEQQRRNLLGINYTGHTDSDKQQCPAMKLRGIETINRWHGNVAQPKKEGDEEIED